jgi:hypothetical protein
MLSPLPRRSDGASSLLIRPVVSAFPDRVVGSACASTFSRFARRSLTLRPAHSRCHQFVTRITEGFSHFVTSIAAPVASGWSGCRVGLAPTGKRHLFTAHTHNGPSLSYTFKGRFGGTTALRVVSLAGGLSAEAVISNPSDKQPSSCPKLLAYYLRSAYAYSSRLLPPQHDHAAACVDPGDNQIKRLGQSRNNSLDRNQLRGAWILRGHEVRWPEHRSFPSGNF